MLKPHSAEIDFVRVLKRPIEQGSSSSTSHCHGEKVQDHVEGRVVFALASRQNQGYHRPDQRVSKLWGSWSAISGNPPGWVRWNTHGANGKQVVEVANSICQEIMLDSDCST